MSDRWVEFAKSAAPIALEWALKSRGMYDGSGCGDWLGVYGEAVAICSGFACEMELEAIRHEKELGKP